MIVDVEDVLEALGIEVVAQRGPWYDCLCLDRNVSVLTPIGWRSMYRLEKEKRHELTLSALDHDGRQVWARATFSITPRLGRQMFRLEFEGARRCGSQNRRIGCVITEDHPVLTKRGWVRAEDLKSGDLVVSGESAPCDEQRNMLDGMMLGDSSITRNGSVGTGHCVAQREYVELKRRCLSDLRVTPLYERGPAKTRINTNQQNTAMFSIRSSLWGKKERARWYPNGRRHKFPPLNLQLSLRALVVWYLDDGSFSTTKYGAPRCSLACSSWPIKTREILVKQIKLLGYEARATKNSIAFSVDGSRRFVADAAPFVPECMRYKLPSKSQPFNADLWKFAPAISWFEKIRIKKLKSYNREKVYSISVPGFQNFVTKAGVFHNCPLHLESHPSFSIHEDGGWVCRHGGQESGSLVELVMRVKQLPYREARQWLERINRRLPSSEELVGRLLNGREEPLGGLERWRKTWEGLPINVCASYWFERGFTKETLRRFEVRYDAADASLTWPVRDSEGRLLGFTRRLIQPRQGPKYLYSPGFKRVLFPLNHLEGTDVVLVEGPLDAMWLHQHGYDSALALLGSNLKESQARWLLRHVTSVRLLFDADEAGEKAAKGARRSLAALPVRVLRLPEGRSDPQELSKKELEEVLL